MSDETTEYNDEDKDRLITLPEAAEIYGFTSDYLSELARRNRLKAKQYGRVWLTTQNDVEDYIRSRKKRGVYRDDIQLDD